MKEIVLIIGDEDSKFINKYVNKFQNQTDKELTDHYNSGYRIGFVGKAQGLIMAALHLVFLKRFDKSPFTLKDGLILGFTEPIELKGDRWQYRQTE